MVARHLEYIPYGEICYISGSNRTCLVYTRTGQYNPYCSVTNMVETLADNRFYQYHRSHIINLDHVQAVLRDKVAMGDDR